MDHMHLDKLILYSLNAGIERSGVCSPALQNDSHAHTAFLDDMAPFLRTAGVDEAVIAYLAVVASVSPYLARLMRRAPARFCAMLRQSPAALIAKNTHDVTTLFCASPLPCEADVKSFLRECKNDTALLMALLDLCSAWPVMDITQALSDFADLMVQAAFRAATLYIAARPDVNLDSLLATPEQNAFCVLAMGKFGAGELNYSSDIDITVFYDTAQLARLILPLPGARVQGRGQSPQEIASKITRLAVSILHDQTAQGYVFRVDLRLRPDPSSSEVAISLEMAESYYEVYGQNWERAAFIKARQVYGGLEIGAAIAAITVPFVWRKYLDFAAIEDIHAIKRQIHAVKGGGTVVLRGHDVKLGRGGIREIEFFVQTQQLILGGKYVQLRARKTLEALQFLTDAGQVSQCAKKEMLYAYQFLRQVEHRLQMVNDVQTHMLPKDAEAFQRIANMMGYAQLDAFEAQLAHVFRLVNAHYADLFETEEETQDIPGSLVFTGVAHDPSTLETLQKMGFEHPEMVSDAIRDWHRGGMRATRSARARSLLTRLEPILLLKLSNTGAADWAFSCLDRFFRAMPTGVQTFSLFLNNPDTLDTLITLLVVAPSLSREMARRRHLLEALLEREFLLSSNQSAPVTETKYLQDINAIAAREDSVEAAMNAVRRYAGEARFQAAARYIVSAQSAHAIGQLFSDIADACIRTFLPIARAQMERQFGDMPGALAVIGLGRLGTQSLTANSDIDLIFVYDAPDTAMESGSNTLDSMTYYLRLVRRLITALSAVTEEGHLFDVDMQLRPSGRAGPAAVSLAAFRHYYKNDAWTWEKMALIKARVIAAEGDLGTRLQTSIAEVLTQKTEPEMIKHDILTMRTRLLNVKPAISAYDVKLAKGGLTEIDFLCHCLVLCHNNEKKCVGRHTQDIIVHLRDQELLAPDTAAYLMQAHEMLEGVLHYSRAGFGEVIKPEQLSRHQAEIIARLVDVASIDEIQPLLEATYQQVQRYYQEIVGS